MRLARRGSCTPEVSKILGAKRGGNEGDQTLAEHLRSEAKDEPTFDRQVSPVSDPPRVSFLLVDPCNRAGRCATVRIVGARHAETVRPTRRYAPPTPNANRQGWRASMKLCLLRWTSNSANEHLGRAGVGLFLAWSASSRITCSCASPGSRILAK